jgi:homogentisate phytyltransferase/homogentisate geranylgeranyltransferase
MNSYRLLALNINWQKFIKNIEDAKIGLPVFLLLLSSAIFIRNLIETLIMESGTFIPLDNLQHGHLFFLAAFISSVLLVTYLSKERVDKVSKIVLPAYTILVILVPIMDLFIVGQVNYSYIYDFSVPLSTPNWSLIARAYVTFCAGLQYISMGQRIATVVLASMATFYVFVKTNSTARTLVTPFAVYTLTFFYASYFNFFSFGTLYETYRLDHFPNIEWIYFNSVLIILIVIQLLIWLLLYNKSKFIGLVKSLAVNRSMHYLAMAGVGAFLAEEGAYSILVVLVCILLLWQSAAAINDLHDVVGDTVSKKGNLLVNGTFTRTELKSIAVLSGLLALVLATTLSYAAILLVLCIIAVSTVYSIPPLRLKKYPIASIFMISVGALLAFSLGFFSGSTDVVFPMKMAYGILICFTLAFNTKDLKDYEGDKANGVWSIPVIFGMKRGRVIIAVLDFLAYIAVPFILGINDLLLPAIGFGAATLLVVLRKESKEWQIFLLYFLFLIIVFFMMI